MKKIIPYTLIVSLVLLTYASLAQPTRNKAVNLTNGEGDFLTISNDFGKLVAGSEFTFETWIKLIDNGGDDFTFFDFQSNGRRLSFVLKENSYFQLEADGGSLEETDWKLDNLTQSNTFENQWKHVILTYNGGSNIAIYVDGVKVLQQDLQNKSGSANISELYPDNGSDYQHRIGGTSENGTKGKAYLADTRIWKKRIPHSTLTQYWDEAINKSHPNYSDLLRYYTFNSDYLQVNGTTDPAFPDHTNTYDAQASNSDASRIRAVNQYPTIKPPRFGNNFNLNFTANDCQTSEIDVVWYDLATDAKYEPKGTDVWYELVRDDNTSLVLLSNATSNFTDTDVAPADKYRYRLRTVWKVNGVNYYSDFSEWSDYGTVKDQFSAPTNVTASTDNCDKSVDLSWNASRTPPTWTLERATDVNFSADLKTIKSNLAGSKSSYSATNQIIETDFYYRVIASGTDANGCEVAGIWSSAAAGFTSKAPNVPSNATITQDLVNNTLDLVWSNPSGNNADSWIIKRTKFDGSDEVTYTTALGVTNYSDADLQLCQTYSYTLGAVNECAPNGVFATTDLTGNISTDLSDAITSLTASKGYLPDGVQVEWELNGSLSNIDRFRLYRSRADQNNFSLIKILNNDLIYTDETATGSVFYNYKVVGEAACEDEVIYTNEGIDMGFVIPYGVANGHVEYAGGNPVEDVVVNFEKTAGASGGSLYFDTTETSYVAIDKLIYDQDDYTEMTVELWVKTSDSSDQILASFDRNEYWRLEINGTGAGPGQIGFDIFTDEGQVDMGTDRRIDDDEWHYVAATFDNGNISIYIDGELDVDSTLGQTFGTGNTRYGFLGIGSEAEVFNGSQAPIYPFIGYLDEVRIWNEAKSADEIQANYNRIINGATPGLLAYWRFDEGVGAASYDVSQTNDEFNKRDAHFFGNVTFSSEIPNYNQLGIRGVTNEFGDYTVDYIPYKSGGEIFKVTPTLGQHAFEPSSRTVFVGDGAQTQNGLDFTDISSFTVTGKVTYQNTNVPVSGVSILIDGVQAIGVDNQPVRTNIQGEYEINVPIGFHYLSVAKDGHVFDEGFFPPKNAFGDIQYFEFVEDLTVNFSDSTKVKVAGRVVGGSVQADKKIGFDQSLNNVGTAVLSFELQNDAYNLPTFSVTTDAYSGEYEIELIPEQFLVGNIITEAGYSKFAEDLPVLDLRNDLQPISVLDTVFEYIIEAGDTVNTLVDEVNQYTYNRLSNYTFFVEPTIEVREKGKSGLIGDTLLVFTNQETGASDTLIIGVNNEFGFPVFSMGNTYQLEVIVQEQYNNPFHPNGLVVDAVAVPEANVVINNQLMASPGAVSGKTNDLGVYTNDFIAGPPSMVENGEFSYTLTLEVDVQTPHGNYTWEPSSGEIFRGYVLGSKPLSGTDFVTYGPEIPEIILRDPPGNNSYAFIEKGASYTTSRSWDFDLGLENALDRELKQGASVLTGGVGFLIPVETQLNSTSSVTLNKEYNLDGEFVTTVTFNERIETSSDPENVGSDADVYIGKSYNAYMSKSKNLKPMTKGYADDFGLDYVGGNAVNDTDIVLGIIDGFVVDDTKEETYFLYTQKHIVHELVPSLLTLRDNILSGPNYESQLPLSSRYYGLSNDAPQLAQFKLDTIAQNPAVDTSQISYVFTEAYPGQIDSVALINQQVEVWLNTLAINEMEKVNAQTVRNISVDGSAGAFSSSIKEEFSSAYNFQRVSSMRMFTNSESGINLGGKGFTLNTRFGLTPSFTSTSGENRTNSITFGYVIDERDEGDYYSIDVKYDRGANLTTIDNFTAKTTNREQFWEYVSRAAGTGAAYGGAKFAAEAVVTKMAIAYTNKTGPRVNAYVAAGLFVADVGFALYDMANMLNFRESVHKDMDSNGRYDVSDFAISSPIFVIRGGADPMPI